MTRLFGTNGVRGVVNEELTVDMAIRLGKAIGSFFKGDVAIATDTRKSRDMIRSAVVSGLMSVGSNVIDLGVTPTPAMQHFVGTHDAAGGVMITASHNPPQFNGIKCVGPTGRELTRQDEETIESLYSGEMGCSGWDSVGTMVPYASATDDYVDAVIKHVDADAIRNAGLTAIMDCANGAAFRSAPLLLRKLGVRTITLNEDPYGCLGRPSEPTEENLKDLTALVKSTKADLGIAHDGDADRTAFIADGGRFVGGDEGLSIMAKYALSKNKGTVVTPVSSSSMVDDVVKAAGGTMIRTAVGTPTVTKVMLDSNAVFGGEEGGMIFPEHQLCRDGAMTVAKMLECIVMKGALTEQIGKLPAYHIIKRKIDCPDCLKGALLEFLRGTYKNAKVDTTDGLKLIYNDGWVLARPSGTEPKFRIYSESKIKDVALRRADETEAKAKEYVKSQ
jgi:phosphomannomutase/phosphoglucomutase